MGIDERLDNLDRTINNIMRMLQRLLAILVVSRVIDIDNLEDILKIVKENQK